MRLIVKPHKIEIIKDEAVNEKEINISKCIFEFDEEIPTEYIKKAFFTSNGTTYEQLIVNNECDFPYEAIENKGQVEIGVIAYEVENEEYVQRYNPSPAYFNTLMGSLKEDVENSSTPTPSELEQLESVIGGIQAEQITQNENISTNADDIQDLQENKQDLLTSGVNIKTINEQSILGSGNIEIQGGSGSSDYEELDNLPKINNVELKGNKTLANLGIQPAGDYATMIDIPDVTDFITKEVNNLTNYELKTNTGNNIVLSIDSSTYEVTLQLRNSSDEVISTGSIDLPLETMVIGGNYDNINKKIILTLKNGNTIDVPVADLINGLQSEITSTNKLDASLVDDSLSNNKFVTTAEKTTWNNKSDFSGSYNNLTDKPDLSMLSILDDSGTGNNFLSDDGTYKTVSSGNDNINKVCTIKPGNNSTSNLATAQAIYDYYQTYSILPNIILTDLSNNNSYRGLSVITKATVASNKMTLYGLNISGSYGSNTYYSFSQISLVLTISNNVVTNVSDLTINFSSEKTTSNLLFKDNTSSYTPTSDYHPSTKKYVDDSVSDATSMIVTDGDGSSYLSNDGTYKTVSGGSDNTNKVFVLKELSTSASNLATAQAIYDYYQTNGISPTVYLQGSSSYPRIVLFDRITYSDTSVMQLDGIRITTGYHSSYKYFYQISYVMLNVKLSNGIVTGFEALQTQSNSTVSTHNILFTNNTVAYTPTANYHPATKKYVDDNKFVVTNITGYDATKTQVLKNVNGTLTWVDE